MKVKLLNNTFKNQPRIIAQMLTSAEIKYLREELATSKNPLFFYDDDPDGLSSFLLLYRMHREGRGVVVKSMPKLEMKFFHKVEENNPDKIFVLDLPMIEPEFIEKAKRPFFWLDHHQPQDMKNVKYYNPRIKAPNLYLPTTYYAYQLSQEQNPDDLWIAAVGCLADWHLPDFLPQLREKYPLLLPEKMTTPDDIHHSPLGKLVKIFSFLLKGSTSDVYKAVKMLTRVKSPEEILEKTTSEGKYLHHYYDLINKEYEFLLTEARKRAGRDKLLVYYYSERKWSLTSDLSNELSALYPQKVIIICRKKSGEMKCSLRAKIPINKALERALVGINGYGGGHENACGAVIKEEDWERFLEKFKEEIK